MKIGLDVNPLFGSRGGVGWHVYHLLRAMLELKEEIDFVGYVRPGAVARFGQERDLQELARSPRLRWVEAGQLLLPWRGRWDGLDLFHGPNYKMQTLGRYGGVVTIHDLWMDRHPEYSTKLLGQRPSFLRTRHTARRARVVITDSEHSAKDIVELYGIARERIAVILNGVSDHFHPGRTADLPADLVRRFGLPTDRYILFVGGADPRKNHRTLLQAYAAQAGRLRPYTILVAGGLEHRFGSVPATIRELKLEDRVVCVGNLTIEDMRLLYAHASVFVFPSRFEGFGLPVLEAMACGAPVITSNVTSLPEVAGDAAVLIDPESPAGLGEALVRVLESSSLQATLRAKGLERAARFTWEKTARETVAVYRQVCSSRL